jgi:hypothetical protein
MVEFGKPLSGTMTFAASAFSVAATVATPTAGAMRPPVRAAVPTIAAPKAFRALVFIHSIRFIIPDNSPCFSDDVSTGVLRAVIIKKIKKIKQ